MPRAGHARFADAGGEMPPNQSRLSRSREHQAGRFCQSRRGRNSAGAQGWRDALPTQTPAEVGGRKWRMRLTFLWNLMLGVWSFLAAGSALADEDFHLSWTNNLLTISNSN